MSGPYKKKARELPEKNIELLEFPLKGSRIILAGRNYVGVEHESLFAFS